MAFRLQFNVRLEIAGPELDPADIRALLGIRPNQIASEEESGALDQQLRALLQNEVAWLRDSFPDVLSTDLDDHLRYHLERLRPNAERVRRLTAQGSVRLCVPWPANGTQPVLDPLLVVEAEGLGIDVEIERWEEEH